MLICYLASGLYKLYREFYISFISLLLCLIGCQGLKRYFLIYLDIEFYSIKNTNNSHVFCENNLFCSENITIRFFSPIVFCILYQKISGF